MSNDAPTPARPPVPTLEPAFHVTAALETLQDHGTTRRGHRRVIPIAGGTLRADAVPGAADPASSGAIEAVVLPGGADWQVVRADGSIEIDGRYTARTDRDEYLYLQVAGVRSGDPAVLEAILRGEEVDPADYYFRTAITIETAAARLAPMQNCLFVASCLRSADGVAYTAYRVS